MKFFRPLIILFSIVAVAAFSAFLYISAENQDGKLFDEHEPDVPEVAGKIDKEEYMRLRNEQLGMWRGVDTATPGARARAIRDMRQGEVRLRAQREARGERPAALTGWRALGPAPIPVSASTSYSGRISAIAVHPTNPDIVYVGAAQGGLYRSIDGGANWTALLDDALTLSIGSIAISPSDPSTVFVGTGETAFSSDSFFGVGIYRITNADSFPAVSGPLNKNLVGADIFSGRGVSEILVHPTDPNILFAATAQGVAGIGGTAFGLLVPNAGIYRTTTAMSANPVFEKLTIQGTLGVSRAISDAAIDPANPNRLLVAVVGSQGDGGTYVSTDALAAVPTFTRKITTLDGNSPSRTEFAVNNTGGIVTVYAATGVNNGTVYKSTDGGGTFAPLSGGTGFCNPQCFYDIAIAVDPSDPYKVYLGGSPALVFGRSINGGGAFANSSANLHVDTQAIAVAPSNPNIVYFGSDGGIWRTNDVTATPIVWATKNNSSINATQFQGISLHPVDRNYTLGGTQDNGTQFLAPDGTEWVRSDGGDGGFSVIDRNSSSPTSVTAYHTYFNQQNGQIGFSRATTTVANGDPIWAGLRGCNSSGISNNGINCSDAVLFYAPMVGGPGDPASLYFGTSRLYRSVDTGTSMTDVSGVLSPTARISAIAIAPQNDNIRLVGTTAGTVFLSTTAGAVTMTNVTGPIPNRYVGRAAIDPANANVAYVALNGFGLLPGQHVWKTTNLLSGTPTWTPSGVGIPDVPTNTFAIDPANTQVLFAGTDIGVFRSQNAGATWEPFSEGLPRVAVFGMEFHQTHRVLRISTHGRGMFEYDFSARPTAFDYDADAKADLSVRRPSDGIWYILRGTAGYMGIAFGVDGDSMVPADYDGDGKTDVAMFRPSNSTWYIFNSATQSFSEYTWGIVGDIPVPADHDGDGKADLAIFRPSTGTWYTRFSNGTFSTVHFGVAGDKPLVGDFDGDSKADVAVYRPSDGNWHILKTGFGYFAQTWGVAGDIPVPADYDGDGKTDVAVWRPSTGQWHRIQSGSGVDAVTWGVPGDIPIPADYDGDGKSDVAVFRPSDGMWYIVGSTGGLLFQNFGQAGDVPTQSAFIY